MKTAKELLDEDIDTLLKLAEMETMDASMKIKISTLIQRLLANESFGERTNVAEAWRRQGSLLFRIGTTAANRGLENVDEINVTMAYGSRDNDQREAAAILLMHRLQSEIKILTAEPNIVTVPVS